MLEIQLLLMLMVANGIPVILCRLWSRVFPWPVDGGYTLPDGHPLFGSSKTWRGFLAGVCSAALVSWLLGFSVIFGFVFGLLSLGGDLLSSFIKRRMRLDASSRAVGLDQIPEAIIPLIAGAFWLDYGVTTVLLVTAAFFLLDILVSPLLFQLGIRKRPH